MNHCEILKKLFGTVNLKLILLDANKRKLKCL